MASDQAEIRSSGCGNVKTTKYISRSKKAGLEFPVSKVAKYLKAGGHAERISDSASVYLTAVLEYLTVEVVELAGDAAKDCKSEEILPRHIQLAIQHDKELSKLLKSVTIAEGGVLPNIHPNLFPKKKMKQKDNVGSSS